jgi:hypothetical protein
MKKFKIYSENGELVRGLQFISARTDEEAVQKAKEQFTKRLGGNNLTAVELFTAGSGECTK